jgi:hypothetical protein
MMKKAMLWVAVAVLAMPVVRTIAEEAAADAAAQKTVELTGAVSVSRDAEGLINGVTLTVGEGEKAEAIAVKLDFNGRRLAMAGAAEKSVKVTGVVAEAEGKKMLTVLKFALPEKAVEAPAAVEKKIEVEVPAAK